MKTFSSIAEFKGIKKSQEKPLQRGGEKLETNLSRRAFERF